MSSRNIIIIVIAVVLVIIGVGLYFLFSPASTTTAPPSTGQTGTLPATGNQSNPTPTTGGNSTGNTNAALGKNFGIISTEPTLAYAVSPTNVVTAIEPTGKIIQVTNGTVTTINTLPMQNILSATFSYNGAKILVNFGDPTNPQTSVFDVASQMWTAMPVGLLTPVWSPSDYRIAYGTSNANGTESFSTLNASTTKATPVVLTTLHAQDLALAWPNKNQVALYTKPSDYVAGSAFLFDLTKNTLTPVAVETPGLEMLWSGPALGQISPMDLQFSTNVTTLGGTIALTDYSGNVLQTLKFLTLPTKCLFSSATSTATVAVGSSTTNVTTSTPYLFCGVPRDLNSLSVTHLPDDYNQMSLFTSDDIYRINLQSGAVAPVFNDQTQSLDVSDVSFANNTLFFINRYDQKLYAISLGA